MTMDRILFNHGQIIFSLLWQQASHSISKCFNRG